MTTDIKPFINLLIFMIGGFMVVCTKSTSDWQFSGFLITAFGALGLVMRVFEK